MFGFTTALGVDVGDDAVRIVRLRASRAGFELLDVQRLPLPEDHDLTGAAQALSALARERGASRTRLAGALPASGCALKIADLPPARPAELALVAKFEAESQFPLPLHELVWGYALSPSPAGRFHAVIAGARRTQVDERLAFLQHTGVMPTAMLPAPLAAAAALATPPTGVYLLVVAGTEWTDLVLYDGARLLASRSVLAGLPQRTGWAERVAREALHWSTGQEHPHTAVLLGMVTAREQDALCQTLAIPACLGDPWQDVTDPQRQLPALDDLPAAFATAVGLAKSALQRHPGPNLLPSRVVDGQGQQRKSGWVLAALLAATVLLVPVLRGEQQQLQAARAMLHGVQQQEHRIKHVATPAPSSALPAAQRAMTALQQPENRTLEMLRVLSVKMPKELMLTDLTYERGKTLTVRGRADSTRAVAEALQTVSALAVVEHATLDYSTLAREKMAHGYDFQITCTLTPTEDPTLSTGREKKSAPARTGTVVL